MISRNLSGKSVPVDQVDLPPARNFLEAARKRNVRSLENYIEAGVNVNEREFKSGNTALHIILAGGCFSDKCVQKAKACLELLLDEGADPNAKNAAGTTPLDFVVENMVPSSLAKLLIDHGASLSTKDGLGNSFLARNLASKMPEVVVALLDRAVSFCPETESLKEKSENPASSTSNTQKQRIRLDWSAIVYNAETTHGNWLETKFLNDILSSNQESRKLLLDHPLVKAFLQLKAPIYWRRFGYFYFFWITVTLMLYMSFIWILYNDECQFHPKENNGFMNATTTGAPEVTESSTLTENFDPSRTQCSFDSYTLTIIAYVIIFMFIVGPAFLELRKLFTIGVQTYIRQWQHYVFVAATAFVSITLYPALSLNKTYNLGWQTLLRYLNILNPIQYPVAALGMLAGSLSILIQMTPISFIALYLEMLFKIFRRITLATLAMSPLLVGFFFSFRILITNDKIGVFQLLTMIVSDSDFENLKDENRGVFYDIVAYFFFSAFIIIIIIVLLNFLVGLAVSDVEELRESAKNTNLANQVRSFYIADAIFGRTERLKNTITRNGTKLSYTFEPLNPWSNLSEKLRLELLGLARARCSHPIQTDAGRP